MNDHHYEFIIVGSGAGGASLAAALAQAGKEVLILERGVWEEKFGTFNDAVRFYDGNKLTRIPKKSMEGAILYHTFMAGGTTFVSCANAVRALETPLRERGIDLSEHFNEVEAELDIQPLPERFLSDGSKRIRQAAKDLGYTLRNMPKIVDFERCNSCGLCTFGCTAGAKWTALKPLQQALDQGAEIRYNTRVEKVQIENSRAVGLECISDGEARIYQGKFIVLAAGGLNTPVILKKSGFVQAGERLFMDLLVNVYGKTDGLNQLKEPAMSLLLDECHEDQCFMLSTYFNSPRPTRLIEAGAAGALLNPRKMIGLMVKTIDDRIGKVYQDGSVSKTPTADDQTRIDAGVRLAKTILIQAGADPKSILVTKVQGAHPGGTAAIGEVVDENLQTDIDNLFVCDASVLPETPGLPPILTLLALARFLAGKLVVL